MKHEPSSIALLPTGFVDLMPEDAEKEAYAIQSLMDLFSGYGYRRIKPPLLEFEDSLLAKGPGAALAQDTFRLMDPVSHRMMGLRADITPQIARIVCTRLPKGDDPIRLMYANDVLRTRAGQMRSSRQFCQVGCEIIRDDSVEAYVEALMLVILGVKKLGLSDVTIDLTVPRLLDHILRDLKTDDETALREAVAKRDADTIKAMGNKTYDIFLELMALIGAADENVQKVSSLNVPEIIQGKLGKLLDVVSQVQNALKSLGMDDVRLTFDPLETKGFDYQDGIAFTVFSGNIKAELGRGGYYNVSFGASDKTQSEKAIGFTLYMDTIRPDVKVRAGKKSLIVSFDTDWSDQEKLRAEGWTIIRCEDVSKAPESATHILKNGKPEKIKEGKK